MTAPIGNTPGSSSGATEAAVPDAAWEQLDRLATASDLSTVPTEVVDLGPILGHGAVAGSPISAGTTVAIFGGVALTGADFDQLDHHRQSISIQVDDDVYLVPIGGPSSATYINHSCEPNCRLDGQIAVVAARDIEPGEALTYDYATSDSAPYDEFECLCGQRRCRRKVTGNDWMNPTLQERYDGWFSPYLARKIAALRAQQTSDTAPGASHGDGAVTPPSPR